MNKDFFDICYDQYNQEMMEADRIYQKAGVMLLVLPLFSTALVKLGRIDLIVSCFTRVDIFLYYFFSLVAGLAIVASAIFIFLCVYPRKYETLATMNVWEEWREKYRGYLDKNKDHKASNDTLDKETIAYLHSRLVEAQPVNAQINEKRRKAFQRSVLLAAIALTAIGFQALFYLVLKIQGV